MTLLLGFIINPENKLMHDIKKDKGGENMKKVLVKKMKNSSKAIRYFSSENTLYNQIVTVDGSSGLVMGVSSCPC